MTRMITDGTCTEVSGTKAQTKSKGTTGLEKKTQQMKLDSAAAKPAQPSLPKVKSKNLDVPKLWTEGAASRKPSAAFVVIGHVDHGKSTLMGRVLLETGAVAQRDIDKLRKQAEEIGKSSFALAWVMDIDPDERERGVTVDIAQHHFSTDKADFTILDAPGHRDFVPNMIGGANMADLGVLVVDANQLESGLKGQTREHVLLARAVGLKKMVVAVNKMDGTTPAWDRAAFTSVKEQVEKLLKETGFDMQNVKLVPCSGLKGDNVVKAPSSAGDGAWLVKESQTLISALEEMAGTTSIPDEPIAKPFRMQIMDTFRGSMQSPVSVAGRVSSGNVQVGDVLVVQPSGEQAVVKSIEIANDGYDFAVAGQIATLHLDGDAETLERNVQTGATICSSTEPVRIVKDATALVTAEETLLPSTVDLHLGRLHVPARIAGLLELVNGKGEITKKKPRVVMPGQKVRLAIEMQDGVPVEAGERLVLRSNSATVASGTVERIDA